MEVPWHLIHRTYNRKASNEAVAGYHLAEQGVAVSYWWGSYGFIWVYSFLIQGLPSVASRPNSLALQKYEQDLAVQF